MKLSVSGIVLAICILIASVATASPTTQEFKKWASDNKYPTESMKVLDEIGIEEKVTEATVCSISHTGCRRTKLKLQHSPSAASKCYLDIKYDLKGKTGFQPKYLNVGVNGKLQRYIVPQWEYKETVISVGKYAEHHYDYTFRVAVTDEMIGVWRNGKINGMTITTEGGATVGLVTSKYPKEVVDFNNSVQSIATYKDKEM